MDLIVQGVGATITHLLVQQQMLLIQQPKNKNFSYTVKNKIQDLTRANKYRNIEDPPNKELAGMIVSFFLQISGARIVGNA